MSQLPKGKETPDAYRPVIVPKAVKMISSGKHDERNEQEMIDPVKPLSSKPGKSIAHTTYQTLYSSDLQRSAKWYYKAFGFYITNINPTFAVVEMSPGRIISIHKGIKQSVKIGFVTNNIKALKRQLIKANVKIVAEEENLLVVKDPDGNQIVIRKDGYGMEHVQISVPGRPFSGLTRTRLETRNEMQCIAKRIEDDLEFDRASEEIISLCEREGIDSIGEAFIVSECRHLAESRPGKARPTKVENIFACISITDTSDIKLPEGMEYLKIPPHDYTVFPIVYSRIDILRNQTFEWRADFMGWSFTRPEGNYYILEHYKDDFIYISIPYYWNKGWDEQERKREEQLKNEKSEVAKSE